MKILSALALAAVAAAVVPAARGADKAPKVYVVVFDFSCSSPRMGQQLADSIRLQLRRQKYEVIDRLTTQDVSGVLPADADRQKIVTLMTEQIGANLALYGTLTKAGDKMTADVRCIDLTQPGKPGGWARTISDDTERARSILTTKVSDMVRGKARWKPPETGDEKPPEKFPAPLNANGSFEAGAKGWDMLDGVSTFIEPGPAGRGKVLRVQTDLARDPWLAWRRKLRLGLVADASNPPQIRRDTSYGCVGALEGVHYRSEWIRATPGQRYWLTADMKGKSVDIFFPKVFVKGYNDWSDVPDGLTEKSMVELKITKEAFAEFSPARQREVVAADAAKHPDRYRRECYRWYLACRNEENVWKHYVDPFPPRGGLPEKVKWLRIEIYSYWPPGKFLWDNVWLYKDPRQAAPLPAERARTDSYYVREKMTREALEKKRAELKRQAEAQKSKPPAGDRQQPSAEMRR